MTTSIEVILILLVIIPYFGIKLPLVVAMGLKIGKKNQFKTIKTFTAMKLKIRTSFSTYSDVEFDQLAQHVYKSMLDNAHFPTPIPSLEVLDAAIALYIDCLSKAKRGSMEDTVRKNKAKKALMEVLSDLALYVQVTVKNNDEYLLSSGFDLIKPIVPIGILDKPILFKVNPAVGTGSVELSLKVIHGAHSYLYQYTFAPITSETEWKSHSDTKTRTIINNLVSGEKYVFRVAGIGASPVRVFSEEISSYIL